MAAIITKTHPEIRNDAAYVFHHPIKFLWGDPPTQRKQWGKYHVYVHVPFCRTICTFCTFERKLIQRGALPWFKNLLFSEMDIVLKEDDFSGARLSSVYMGGGTASLLSNDVIAIFLNRLRDGFGLRDVVEVTLECEPGTKNERDFRQLFEAGVNRISIGVQTFNDSILTSLKRHHNTEQSIMMIADAKKAGFKNVHVDLMYGLPSQTFADWKQAVDWVIDLGVQHVSTYRLIVFRDELLARTLHQGILPKPADVEEIEKMRLYALQAFTSAGFLRYSLTEYARPGYQCKYVTSNWNGSDYLGFGPAAYSRNGPHLWENSVLHSEYEDFVTSFRKPIKKGVTMTPRVQLERDIAMGLCLLSVSIPELEDSTGVNIRENFGTQIRELSSTGLLVETQDQLKLTEDGIRYATHVMKCFAQ
jgi:oxygen-independent coproporphyrinogen III oxidase